MKQSDLVSGLYFVATPIGTARDITLRALDILSTADVLAAEDTRNTRKLLDIHGIHLGGRDLIAYHDHNGAQQRPKLLRALEDGKSVAYVSDAGTPLVADPGFALGKEVVAAGFNIFAAPGPSAILAALCVAALPSDRFYFGGFLPTKAKAKATALEGVKSLPATLIFFESPKRILASLNAMRDVLGDRRDVAVCRELTKKFETVYRGTLAEVTDTPAAGTITTKGEFVVVLGPPQHETVTEEVLIAAIENAGDDGSVKEIATKLSQTYGEPRKRIYDLALRLKGKK